MSDQTFILTFGSQYAHRDSWVRIVAPSYNDARRAAFENFGPKWSILRKLQYFDETHFTMGELFAFRTDEDLNYRRID